MFTFSISTHFYGAIPPCPDVLAPLTYIHTTRRNKLAQAVSMAKAYQTSAWTSQMKASTSSAQYSRELIEMCLKDVDQQERDWEQWFASNNVTPFRLVYEDLAADPAAMVRSIIELLGVQGDEPEAVEVPAVEKQSDGTNNEWIARFEAETARGSERHPIDETGTTGQNVSRREPLLIRPPRRLATATQDFTTYTSTICPPGTVLRRLMLMRSARANFSR